MGRLRKDERRSPAERLVHGSTKLLRKAAKTSKGQLVTRAIRKLKAAGTGDARAAAAVAAMKAVDVEDVVAVVLRRCGVAHVGAPGAALAARVAADACASRVAAHRPVAEACREVDARATAERRRALLARDPALRREAEAEARAEAAAAKRSRPRGGAASRAPPGAVFVESLDGGAAAGATDAENDVAVPLEELAPRRKNRVGQRQRRELRSRAAGGDAAAAKTMARRGLKRPRAGEALANGPAPPAPNAPRRAPEPAARRAPPARERPDAAAAHGSWAAARAKLAKERSSTFAGTKIAFGDD